MLKLFILGMLVAVGASHGGYERPFLETFHFDETGFNLVPALKAKPARPEVEIVGTDTFAYELDFTITEELKLKGLARETTNRIQRFRKLSKLSIDDKIVTVGPDGLLSVTPLFKAAE